MCWSSGTPCTPQERKLFVCLRPWACVPGTRCACQYSRCFVALIACSHHAVRACERQARLATGLHAHRASLVFGRADLRTSPPQPVPGRSYLSRISWHPYIRLDPALRRTAHALSSSARHPDRGTYRHRQLRHKGLRAAQQETAAAHSGYEEVCDRP
jgi:hypothetical protein